MTMCGGPDVNKANPLTKENMPRHHEVLRFSLDLLQRISEMRNNGTDVPPYGFASAHEHSCCALLARTDILRGEDGRWRTWIDFERFHSLEKRWAETGEKF